jgi:ABC-type Fe3+ transport system substrate-binding protein
MEKIIMHCPMNISRSIVNMVKEFVEQKYGQNIFELVDEPHRLGNDSNLVDSVKSSNPPALYIGQAVDFGELTKQEISDSFEVINNLPLRKELSKLGFTDSQGHLQVFTVIPFGIIYNKNIVSNFPIKWADFLDSSYKGRVRIPDKQRTISKVIVSSIQEMFPDEYEKFLENCCFEGSPIDVVNSVDNGEYEFGMVNIAFSRFSRHKNTGIIWLPQGAYCMPLIIAVGKNKLEKVEKIVEYVFSEEIQNFLALQGFIPASPTIELPELVKENKCNIIWQGWDNFLSSTGKKSAF